MGLPVSLKFHVATGSRASFSISGYRSLPRVRRAGRRSPALASRRVPTAHHAQQQDDAESAAMTAINVPEEIRKFAPKKVRRGAPMDQSGDDLINMLQKTTFQLQTAEDRISALETAIKQWQDRAAQAETQLLQLIQDQIKRRAG
jgi:hypothetical protein